MGHFKALAKLAANIDGYDKFRAQTTGPFSNYQLSSLNIVFLKLEFPHSLILRVRLIHSTVATEYGFDVTIFSNINE